MALCAAIAVLATGAARVATLTGAPVIGLLAGMAISVVRRPTARLQPGITFCSRRVLQLAVALLGAQLDISQGLAAGVASLPVLLGTLAIALLATVLLGRLLHVGGNLRTLIGAGTAICGASAIAAVAPVVDAAAADVAYALTTVFVFNAAAVMIFPVIGHALTMSQQSFGLFAGTAINDTSSVVATGFLYGTAAGQHAIVVKLTRTLFIVPLCLGLALQRGRRGAGRQLPSIGHLVPWYLVGFLALSALVSFAPPPAGVRSGLSNATLFLITVALVAIGLSTDVGALRRRGAKPFYLGALLWATLIAASLALAAVTGSR